MESRLIVRPMNDILIGNKTNTGNVVVHCLKQFNKFNIREITLSAVCENIGKLVNIVECLKIHVPGLYQNNYLTSISGDGEQNHGNKIINPRMEVILTLDEPNEKTIGTQTPIDEKERIQLKSLHDEILKNKKILSRKRPRLKRSIKSRDNIRNIRGLRGRRIIMYRWARSVRGSRGMENMKGATRPRGRYAKMRGVNRRGK